MSDREVKGTDEVINSAIESLKTHGFINYYGTQRFGSTSIPTHNIGKELLKSNWQQVRRLGDAGKREGASFIKVCHTATHTHAHSLNIWRKKDI